MPAAEKTDFFSRYELANPRAVAAARGGDLREAVRLYGHGGSYLVVRGDSGRALGYGMDRLAALNASPAYRQAHHEVDQLVLARRTTLPLEADGRSFSVEIERRRREIQARFRPNGSMQRRRLRAIRMRHFFRALRVAGLAA